MARHTPEATEELFLQDGEALSLASWERLAEMQKKLTNLSYTLGRTPHYRRKNRLSIEKINVDLRAIESEMLRRKALTTVSFCGLTFHYQATWIPCRGHYDNREGIPDHLRERAIFIEPDEKGFYNYPDGSVVNGFGRGGFWTVPTKVYELSRQSASPYIGNSHREQVIHITEDEWREYESRGAIIRTSPDPNAPWTVAEMEGERGG